MNSAEYVDKLIAEQKAAGTELSTVAWKAALACVGWPYVFGARGQYCTPANRRARYSSDHPTIKTKCKNFEGTGSCSGCKWLPNGKKVRFFDCRGFTYWILLQVYGWKLMGAGATSQWDTEANWKAKGKIGTMPKDTLVCLFVRKGAKMEHTGFGLNNETVECSAGVQHFTSRNKKWTHWGVPACIDGKVDPTPTPTPDPGTEKPTLRRGDKGPYVSLLQTELIQRGYDVGSTGVDGDFGRATETAVKNFQTHNGLTADGIVGPLTWAALDNTEPSQLYTVHIPHLPLYKAEGLVKSYTGAYMTKED